MNEVVAKKVLALIEDEAVKAQLENSESIEDIVAILKNNGIEISAEDVKNGINSSIQNGELDAETLEEVAGGYCSKGRNWKCLLSFMKGYVEGILSCF